MDEKIREYFEQTGLGAYTFRQRVLIRSADMIAYLGIKLLRPTYRVEFVGENIVEALRANGRVPLFAVWHEHILSVSMFLSGREWATVASKSLDGEYIARFLKRLRSGVVRGSSSRGGVDALVGLGRIIRAGHPVVITVDGPKGPPHEVKPGIAILARKTGNPVVPISIEARSYKRLGSWDGMRIPMPFTRLRLTFGDSIEVPRDDSIERKLLEIKRSLDELEEADRVWRESNIT